MYKLLEIFGSDSEPDTFRFVDFFAEKNCLSKFGCHGNLKFYEHCTEKLLSLVSFELLQCSKLAREPLYIKLHFIVKLSFSNCPYPKSLNLIGYFCAISRSVLSNTEVTDRCLKSSKSYPYMHLKGTATVREKQDLLRILI